MELQGRPLFRVRSRRFAVVNRADSPARPRWQGAGRSLHVVTDPAEREALRQDPRFVVSPHHGDRGWLALSLDAAGGIDWDEVAELLEAAYRHVAGRRLVERLDGGGAGPAPGGTAASGPGPQDRPGRPSGRRPG